VRGVPPPARQQDDTLDRAVDAADLVAILQELYPGNPEVAKLTSRGGVICDPRPGREERNPSFSVQHAKGRWLWHRIGKPGASGKDEGGNAFNLLTSIGMSKRDAAKWLIDRTGTLPSQTTRQRPRLILDPLEDIRQAARKWTPVSAADQVKARFGPLLEARGFTEEHANAFGLANSTGGIRFNITDPLGQVVSVKKRLPDSSDPEERGGTRYVYEVKEHGAPPWCSPEIKDAPILLVEGEFNAIAASIARPDLQVIGLAGTSGLFNPDWVKDRNVYVYGDGDPDGRGLQARDRNAHLVQLAGGNASPLEPLEWPQDFNDVLRDHGEACLAEVLTHLLGEAPAPEPDREQYRRSGIEAFEHGYCRRTKDGDLIRLTNWTFQPEAVLHYPDLRRGTRGTAQAGNRQLELDIPSEAWNSRTSILEILGARNLLFLTASNSDVAKVRDYLIELESELKLPIVAGIETYGEHKVDGGRVSVFQDVILGPEGELEEAGVFYAGPQGLAGELHQAPPSSDPRQAAAATEAARKSLGLINADAALAIACKAGSSLLAPRLTARYRGRNPFLAVAGEREAGKSSFAELWLRITTGRTARTVKAPDLKSDFQYDAAFSNQNNQLALLDEYHPDHVESTWIKGHYDLAVKRRGIGKGAQVETYHRNSPTIILGQHVIDDAATRSRTIQYVTLPAERGSSADYSAVARAPLEHLARPLLQAALGLPDDLLADWYRDAEKVARDILGPREPRLEYALIDLAIGAKFLNHTLALGITSKQVRQMLQVGVETSLEGGSNGQRDSLEVWLEQLGYVAKLRPPANWWDFFAIPDRDTSGNQLLIRSAMCVELVKGQYRDKAAIQSARMLGQLALSLPYFTGGTNQHKCQGEKRNGCCIVFEQAPERVDLDALKDIAQALATRLKEDEERQSDSRGRGDTDD
jgi:hypothetical protein